MRESDTRRIATEVVVIVGSILPAFALDAWWDQRQERARVDEMLDATALEFEREVLGLDSIIQANEVYSAFLDGVIDRTDPTLPPISDDSLALLAAGQTDHQIYDPGFGSLSALISTGGLEQVRDLDLQRRLAGWTDDLDDLDWERGQAEDAVARWVARTTERGTFLEAGNVPAPLWIARSIRDDPSTRRICAEVVFMYAAYTSDLRRIRARAAALAADLRAR